MSAIEAWLEAHADLLVLGMIAIGLVLRVEHATYAYLHADEALHFLVATQATLPDVLRAGSNHAHPPLLYVFLWLWRGIGDSELMLRLPMALAGSGAIWFVYRWAALAIETRTAVLAAGLLAFSPSMIGVVTEVRQYALMLLFATAALYALEVAFARRSARWLATYLLCFVLAILCHYSVAWFAVGTGIYALARIAAGDLPRGLARGWLATQAVAGCVYLLLFRFHLTNVNAGPLRETAIAGYLHHFYLGGGESPWRFFAGGTVEVFAYQLASAAIGDVGFALFCLGLVWLAATGRWRVALLLVVPFGAAFAGALAHLTPYGGSRHASVLAPFVAVGASTGLAAVLAMLAGRRMVPIVAVLAIVAIGWSRVADSHAYDVLRAYRKRDGWLAATTHLRTTLPPGSVILTDSQTALQLGYYLARDRDWHGHYRDDRYSEYAYGGYRVISAPDWRLRPHRLRAHLSHLRDGFGLTPATPIWIVIAGRSSQMYPMLAERHAIMRTVPHVKLGGSIAVFQGPPADAAW